MKQKTKVDYYSDAKYGMLADIGYTSAWIKNLWTEFLNPYGISTQQFNILRILRKADGWMTMNDVKELMFEKSPNATRLADKLISKDLIDRKRSPEDRRVVYIKITLPGVKLLEEIDSKNRGPHLDYVKNVTEKEALQISELLAKLKE
jgi:DNA-binding MarR family transcriptional regulator